MFMQLSLWIKIGGIVLAIALIVCLFEAWGADRRDRAQLQSQLAAAQKSLDALTAQQKARDVELQASLAQLTAQEKAVRTPQQALRALPEVLPLPTPLHAQNLLPPASPVPAKGLPNAPSPKVPVGNPVVIPPEDLKPLYDFALECKACQDRLAATQADLADEQAKNQQLSRERDDALNVARGGSLLHRVGRAAKWFAIGAAAGAFAAKYAH
jgi:hypothetical protein